MNDVNEVVLKDEIRRLRGLFIKRGKEVAKLKREIKELNARKK